MRQSWWNPHRKFGRENRSRKSNPRPPGSVLHCGFRSNTRPNQLFPIGIFLLVGHAYTNALGISIQWKCPLEAKARIEIVLGVRHVWWPLPSRISVLIDKSMHDNLCEQANGETGTCITRAIDSFTPKFKKCILPTCKRDMYTDVVRIGSTIISPLSKP